MLGMHETKGQQAQVAIHLEFAPRDFLHGWPAIGALGPFEANAVQLLDDAIFAGERLGVDREIADAAFLMRGARAINHWPIRPRHVRRAPFRRTRKELELVNAGGALAMRGAETVRAGVAAAEDDHVLVLCADELIVGD